MSDDESLREQIVNSFRGTTERRFEQTVAEFPAQSINLKPPNVDYSFWFLLEHLRLSQWDLLDYSRNPNYKAVAWPDDYWPRAGTQADAAAWQSSIERFRADREAFVALLQDPKTDLTATIPNTPGHTILREALLNIGHSSYHLGEFGILREVTQTWPPGHV
jgi:hypothetical protein